MKLVEKMRAKKDDGPRTFSFNLSMSHVLSASVVGILGLCWVFILGVLVGRGYKPENSIPDIAKYMPTTPPPKEEQPESTLPLRADELHYQDTLIGKAKPPDLSSAEPVKSPWSEAAPNKADPAQLKAAAAANKALAEQQAKKKEAKAAKDAKKEAKGKDAKAEPKADSKAETKDKSKESVTAAQKDGKTDSKTAKADAKTAKTDGKAKEVKPGDTKTLQADQAAGKGKFSASYQLSSYDNAEAAKADAAKLNKTGLKTQVQEVSASGGVKKYRIVTTLTGTEEEIRAALEKSGAKGAILRGKKPL